MADDDVDDSLDWDDDKDKQHDVDDDFNVSKRWFIRFRRLLARLMMIDSRPSSSWKGNAVWKDFKTDITNEQ